MKVKIEAEYNYKYQGCCTVIVEVILNYSINDGENTEWRKSNSFNVSALAAYGKEAESQLAKEITSGMIREVFKNV